MSIFNAKLKRFETPSNANAVNGLEKSLIELKNAIDNKAQPREVMLIIHTKLHPNLQVAFNLKLKK